MKNIRSKLFMFTCIMCICFINFVSCNSAGNNSDNRLLTMKKPLVTPLYTADPSAHVFEGRLYIYPSHDLENTIAYDNFGSQFDMKDYHVFSISDFNSPVVDHGQVLHVNDVPWAEKQFWAPDAAFKNNTYYLYFPAKDAEGIFRIGAATSTTPHGPFAAQNEPIPGSFSIDPAVFIDDDGQAYMYFGGLLGGQLERWTGGKYNANGKVPGDREPALGPRVAKMAENMLEFDGPVQELRILDNNERPVMMNDRLKIFFEAAWMHKYNGIYYLSYSTGFSRSIVYATGKNPYGPFIYRGIILRPVIGWTNHHSIVQYRGAWYLFYHEAAISEAKMHLRTMKYTKLIYNADGTIQTITP